MHADARSVPPHESNVRYMGRESANHEYETPRIMLGEVLKECGLNDTEEKNKY